MSNRTKVFICYSHNDMQWLERLQVHLKPMERVGFIEPWDDTRIAAGKKWRDEIKRCLDDARVAVLLISADFLASDFIVNDELPPLLAAENEDGLVILPFILSPSRFSRTPNLEQFQAVNDPARPLVKLSLGEQEEAWVKLTEEIEKAFEEVSHSRITSVEDQGDVHEQESTPLSEGDLKMLVVQWVVSNPKRMNGQIIKYADVDKESSLPVGSAKKHLENAAKSQRYIVAQKSDLFIRFESEVIWVL